MVTPRAILLCLLAILAAFVSGCANMPAEPAREEVAKAEAGYGRAFGRFVVVQDGKPVTSHTDWFGMSKYWLFVQAAGTGQMFRMDIKGDGTFIWPLQGGEYVILAAETVGPIKTFRLWLTFSVPRAEQAVYVGDLNLEVTKQGAFRFGVKDNYEEVLRAVEPQLVKANLTAAKSLMQPEKPPGSYRGIWRICAEKGGLKCEENFAGVKPVLPSGAATSYPVVPSLFPLLEWEPSTTRGIKYDVAIYESIGLGLDMPGQRRLRGALVEYAEGLDVPRYQVKNQLKAATKYEWSVRLRDGDFVSTWSTTSYMIFFVVGMHSASGQWFGFATPQK